jgi:hypothetical protein
VKLIILFTETDGFAEGHAKKCYRVASTAAKDRWSDWWLVRLDPPAHPLLPLRLASLDAALLSPGAKGLAFEQLIARGWPLPVGVRLIDGSLALEPEWLCKAVLYPDTPIAKREIAAEQCAKKVFMDRLDRLRSRD